MLDEIDTKFAIDSDTKRLLNIPSNDMISVIRPYLTSKEMDELIALCRKGATGTLSDTDNYNMCAIVQRSLIHIHVIDKVVNDNTDENKSRNRKSIISKSAVRRAIDEKTGTRLSSYEGAFCKLNSMQGPNWLVHLQENIEWSDHLSCLSFMQMALFMLYPSPVQVLVSGGDTYDQTTIGPSLKNATHMMSNGMAESPLIERFYFSFHYPLFVENFSFFLKIV